MHVKIRAILPPEDPLLQQDLDLMHVKLRKFSKKNLHSWRRLKEKWDHQDHLAHSVPWAHLVPWEQQDYKEHLAFLALLESEIYSNSLNEKYAHQDHQDHPDQVVFPADQDDKEQQDHLEHLAFLAHQLENDLKGNA